MWSSRGFRFPDGAKLVSQSSGKFRMQISIPPDEDGFLGRQCPACSQVFRVAWADFEPLPDDLRLWCVYCGHHDDHSEFMTRQQLDRALRVAGDLGVQHYGRALDKAFGRASRRRAPSSRGGIGIQLTYRSKPFYPQPLPGINEERLIRVRQCAACGLRYAVFGEHRYCPVCGELRPKTVALDALQAETVKLDGLRQLPAETAATLREQGVFTSIWIDTLENLVGLIEHLARSVFHAAVPDAAQLTRGNGNVFQRLDDTAELFLNAGYRDLRTIIDAHTWQRLREAWAARHLFTHNDGIVDERYLTRVLTIRARPGQRLTISEKQCRQAIADVEALCVAIADLTDRPNGTPGSTVPSPGM